MSNKRYLEFDSTYRNRNCYPCPAEFTTRVSCAKESDTGLTANDYVANEYPTNSWYQVPYAGADATDILNTDYVLSGPGTGLSGLDIQQDIPMVINGKSYSSLYPVDWMNGGSTAYFAQLSVPTPTTPVTPNGGPIRIGSGVASKTYPTANATAIITMGTRFQGAKCDGSSGNQLNSPNNSEPTQRDQFWISTSIRNRNIIAPEMFSGGTASAPQLGPKSVAQGKVKNYFAGALLFRFTKNPLLDTGVSPTGVPADGIVGNDIDGFGNNANNGTALLGGLGFPYYYQTITLAVPPPVPIVLGTQINSTNSSNNPISGFVASIISQQEVVIRLGAAIPIGNNNLSQVTTSGGAYTPIIPSPTHPPRNLFPGVPPNLQAVEIKDGATIAFSSAIAVTVGNVGPVTWGTPSSVSTPYPAYFWTGFVESAVIQTYDESSGLVTLDHPFSNSGTNGFNTSSDYYLMDFNTDPSGHWSTKTSASPYVNINEGKARTFFPAGLDIPNYYSGRKITNVSQEEITTETFGLQDTSVSSYDNKRRVLTLSSSLVLKNPAYRGVSICSQYTIVCLAGPIGEELPEGSFIAWNGTGASAVTNGGTINGRIAYGSTSVKAIPTSFTSPKTSPTQLTDIPGVYYVAVTAPKNATYIVLQGSRNPFTTDTALFRTSPLLNMLGGPPAGGGAPSILTAQPSVTVGSVQVPPYSSPEILAYWRDMITNHWSDLTPDPDFPLNIAGLHGAQTILSRGKRSVPQDNNLVPYIPMSSVSVPGNCPVTLRNSGVLSLDIEYGGLGYSINDPTMPLMALINVPLGSNPWDPLFNFPGMSPFPENFIIDGGPNTIYTFLNICFVNVKSVGANGEILELEVNTPGSEYPSGTKVFIIDGAGSNVSTYDAQVPAPVIWREGLGRGAVARVTTTAQFLGIAGGSALDLPSIPPPGSLVDMISYGWGQSKADRTKFNSAPDFGEFIINYSGSSGFEYTTLKPQLPLEIQNCLADETTYPETGTRVITSAFRSINNQVLIASKSHPHTDPTYQSFQYPAPGAYLGGSYGFGKSEHHLNMGGINDVLWIALESNYDISKCVNSFAFSRDGYVSGNYSFGNSSGNYSDVGNISIMPLIPHGIPDVDKRLGQWTDQRTLPMGQRIIPSSKPYIQGGLQMSNSLTGNWIQIMSFARDNEKSLNYTGSTTSQNQMVCYEIELISLILPNLPLDNTIGGLIAFYPYLYVELSNKTAPSGGTKGVLYSNNPHANRALFRVAIDDTPTPIISKFIKVDGDGAVQTVKFKPNDNLYIRVFLQNGQLFETKQRDTPPPMVPDPFVQISAEFSIKRL